LSMQNENLCADLSMQSALLVFQIFLQKKKKHFCPIYKCLLFEIFSHKLVHNRLEGGGGGSNSGSKGPTRCRFMYAERIVILISVNNKLTDNPFRVPNTKVDQTVYPCTSCTSLLIVVSALSHKGTVYEIYPMALAFFPRNLLEIEWGSYSLSPSLTR